jgi:K+-transporting ATPase KdpF subunit
MHILERGDVIALEKAHERIAMPGDCAGAVRSVLLDGPVVGTTSLIPHAGTGRRQDVEVLVHLIGGVVSAFLFVYLVLALMKPEWFA